MLSLAKISAEEFQAQLQEQWVQQYRERNGQLDVVLRECLECQMTARHYVDDYMCCRCRDHFEAQ